MNIRFSLIFAVLISTSLSFIAACGGSSSPPTSSQDTTPPVITLNGESEIRLYINSEYTELGATAMDDVDGVVPVSNSNNINTRVEGSYTVTYSASDSSGNMATAQRSVIVTADRISNLNCLPPDPTNNDTGTLSIEASFPSLPLIDAPLAMVQPQNDSSFWLVAARNGRVIRFDNNSNANEFQTVLDITSRVTTISEMGLTGLVIHPNYPQDNRVFVVYNDSENNRRSTISSFTINTSTQIIDDNSETRLITLPQPANNHNGGDIAFGSDGYLYVSFGDGGLDSSESQDLTNLHGSILRLDVSGSTYSIPQDNPFNIGQTLCSTGSRANGDCPEIYAYGFRNPWRFSFDQLTGELWVADVGEDTFEEVDRVISGGNYGWPIMEGNECFNGANCSTGGLELPVTQYPRSVGVSTVGGYVYRGDDYPSLVGHYIWGDTFSSQFLTIPANSPVGSDFNLAFNSARVIAGLAQGNDGEVYLLNLQGDPGDEIYRVTASGGTSSTEMPSNLSEVGCFNTASKSYAQGVISYHLNSELWSDGALKDRAFAIPDETTIEVESDGDFIFPENSILIKHFLNGDTYLETRLFVNLPGGWQGFSYEWNDQQTDAVLLNEGKTEDVGDFVHTYPSQAECAICHTQAANFSLGIEVAQLNRVGPIATNNQLDLYSDIGLLDNAVDSSTSPTLYSIDDDNASFEQRARSYLHSNCSGCHRPGAQGDFIDLRFDTTLSQTNICDVAPQNGDLGVNDARIVAPGEPERSVLFLRMNRLDSDRMPPLASLVEDEQATQIIQSWITSITNCN